MDNRLPKNVTGIPIVSTRDLFLSKAYQSHNPLPIKKNEHSYVVSAKSHVGLGAKLIETVKHKLSYGSKLLPLGREGKIFRRRFSRDGEKLLHASQCSIYTTAGAITDILFISTERIGFCSERAVKTYSTSLEVLKFQYKVSIPLEKIKGVEESTNLQRPCKKYMELVTVDDFSFWFLGFPNYKKVLRYLRQITSHDCLSD
ncbi:GEM-like protein 6 isoform X1 [Tanacetum coccineum]